MILIVADTGPINYLIQIGYIELLAALADTTVLPTSVAAELLHPGAPEAVRSWAAAPPGWVQIGPATELVNAEDLSLADREAIALAISSRCETLSKSSGECRAF
jgi:predicted nucleic acid-binding protein